MHKALILLGSHFAIQATWMMGGPMNVHASPSIPGGVEHDLVPVDERAQEIFGYATERGFIPRVEAAREARQSIAQTPPGLMAAAPITSTVVQGVTEVPVIPVSFDDTTMPPFDVTDMQRQLFDGPWDTGTMSEHFREMSRGRLEVQGTVFEWTAVTQNEVFYTGPTGCNGICNSAKVAEMLTEALKAIDATIDFSAYDNDGPDGRPNSGDDDGFIDFVAFVHPSLGGECGGAGNNAIWSHSFSFSGWTGTSYATDDTGFSGQDLRIDDYVIMPGLACDQTTMIQIGVFSHEFGHAFGLPDLYDSVGNEESAGIGVWGLMASGSWGNADATRPETPTHMSAWAKEYLGWVSPREVTSDTTGILLRPVISSGEVIRVDYSDSQDPNDERYLLLEYRTLLGFDAGLPQPGLLVTEINNAVVAPGLVNNSVNASPFNMGVNVIEADGARDLDNHTNKGDGGDVFPGTANMNEAGDALENIGVALCNIEMTPSVLSIDVFTSRTTCPDATDPSLAQPSWGQIGIGDDVTLSGVIENVGTNFFTDRDLVLRNAAGELIPVTPPALLGVAPSDNASAPETLSDLLGREVVVSGKVLREPQKNRGITDYLQIEQIAPAGE
ncbi:MAG: M6 family metalloprotease domain-containing protein [Paracoccaceae bacterium]